MLLSVCDCTQGHAAFVSAGASAHLVCVSAQNHLAVFTVVHPLAPSVSSSVASSLASSAGSSGSSPTALPILSARAHPLDLTGNALEAIPGKPTTLVSLTPLSTHIVAFGNKWETHL